MDITGAVAYRLREDQINELDDGRLSIVIQDILRPFQVMCQATQRLGIQILNNLGRGLCPGVIEAIQGSNNFPLWTQDGLDRRLEERADVVEWLEIECLTHGDQDDALLLADRH